MQYKSMLRRTAIRWFFISIVIMICIQSTSADSTPDPFSIHINVGGRRLTDNQGIEWLEDHIYRSSSGYGYLGLSSVFEKSISVTGTTVPELYQSERYKLFGYRIDVPNGNYIVKLHFAEIYYRQAGKREFDIKIEGHPVKERLDIYNEVGENHALVLEFDTEKLAIPITDNRLDIEFISIKDDTKLSGIEVVQKDTQPTLLLITPTKLDFSDNLDSLQPAIKNIGVKNSTWHLSKGDILDRWIILPSVITGSLNPSEEQHLTIRIDRSALKKGINEANLVVNSNEFSTNIMVSAISTGSAEIATEPQQLNFGSAVRSLPLTLMNDGGTSLDFSVVKSSIPRWIKRIYPISGIIPVGEKAYLNLVIDRSQLNAGTHTGGIDIRSSTNSCPVTISVTVPVRVHKHIYVNINNTGKEDGRSWETGYRTISGLISRLRRIPFNEIIEIWVAQGTYYEHDIEVPSLVHLYGGFSGVESHLEEREHPHNHPTIIDAQRRGRCLEIADNVVIDGFVLENGRDWGTGEGKGAAILAYDNRIRISNNIIRNNVDSWAGAVFIDGFDESRKVNGARPIIEYNVFTDNFSNYCAAALEIRGSEAIVRNNTIVRNQGYGLEIQDLLGPFQKISYGDFYNNIIVNNVRQEENNVWAEARKSTNYSFVGNKWSTLVGAFKPYDHGIGNIFADETGQSAGFIDERRDDFRLLVDSPCIDAGDPDKGYDSDGTRSDMGAFPYRHDLTELAFSQKRIDFGSESLKRYLSVRAYGGTGTHWCVVPDDEFSDYITIESSSGYLKNGEESRLEFTLRRDSIQDGVYHSYCSIMSPHQSKEVDFSFIVNNSMPELAADPTSVKVVGALHGENPKSRRIQVTNLLTGALHWSAKKNSGSDWLQLSNDQGAENDFVTLDFNTTGLSLGEYHEDIIIESPNSVNTRLIVPVNLNIQTETFFKEIQAESATSISSAGWKISTNKGETCIQALKDDFKQPNDITRVDYPFEVPAGVDYIHVFAEVDVVQSKTSDSFWITINGFDPCQWDYIDSRFDGWIRSWVYDVNKDKQHTFVVRPGVNTLNIYSREKGGYINWFVITNDPDVAIKSFEICNSFKP